MRTNHVEANALKKRCIPIVLLKITVLNSIRVHKKNNIQRLMIHERREEKIIRHGNDECAHRCLANLVNSDWNELTDS